jgi:hypothetical protein
VRLHHRLRPPTTIPLHDVIGPGLLRKILRDTGLSASDLFADVFLMASAAIALLVVAGSVAYYFVVVLAPLPNVTVAVCQ